MEINHNISTNTSNESMDYLLNLTKVKLASSNDESKLDNNANGEETSIKTAAEVKVAPPFSAPVKPRMIGIKNEAQLARAAVDAATAAAEHGTLIPGLLSRSISVMSLDKLELNDDSDMAYSNAFVAKMSGIPSGTGISVNGNAEVEKSDFEKCSPKRCDGACTNLQDFLEDHQVKYPKYVDEDDEDEEVAIMDTIWEESGEESGAGEEY